MSTLVYVVILIVLYAVIMFFYNVICPRVNKKIQLVKKARPVKKIQAFKNRLLKEVLYSIRNGLNSPSKRIGFLFFIIGIVIFLVSAINIPWDWFKRGIGLWVFSDSIFFFKSHVYFNIGIFLGFYISVIGLFTSILYDITIKKIIEWIFRARK